MFSKFIKILLAVEETPSCTLPVLIITLLLTVLIGYIRYLTGPEFALSLLYLFPVAFVSWTSGFKAGVFISLASALSWLVADLSMIGRFSQWYVPYVNELFRTIVFLFITFLIARLKQNVLAQTALARTDPLTGIANRRAFVESADLELKKARRLGYPISMIYFDLDNFKSINDLYGHSEGDRLLKLVAGMIRENIRAFDIAARFGGDEYGLLLPGTEASAAYSVAIKIIRKLLLMMKENNWETGISAGIATYETIPNHIEEMIQYADTLMYAAKKQGTNLIVHQVVNGSVTRDPFYNL
ncbi:MAG: diguanylate cyclase [Pseudomonadota bacterium]